jgi:hypothetical protein
MKLIQQVVCLALRHHTKAYKFINTSTAAKIPKITLIAIYKRGFATLHYSAVFSTTFASFRYSSYIYLI